MDATAATPVLLVLVLALPLLALLLLRSSSSRQGGPLRRIRTLLLLLWKERDGDPRAPFHADAVLILGGDRDRELCALALVHARELHQHDDDGPAMVMDYDRAPVIVSSGAVGPEDLAAAVAMARGGGSGEEAEAEAIQELRKRVVWDRRAVCTVTNFTTVAPELRRRGARGVLVATSPYHLQRAMGVARVVLGAEGLMVRGVGVPNGHSENGDGAAAGASESLLRRTRDVLRAWVWACTGWDGGGVVPWVHQTRRPAPP